MTSTASPARSRTAASWLRSALLVALLSALAYESPYPWGTLWIGVPAAVALSLLAGWRFGVTGAFVPVAVLGVTLVAAGPMATWAWWIPAAALTGLWMGLREEGDGPSLGHRAWMLLPLLLLAAALPWTPSYGTLVRSVERQFAASDREMVGISRQMHRPVEQQKQLEATLAEQAKLRGQVLPELLPAALFLWLAVLVMAGRALASRVARVLGWPPLSRAAVSRWRLPDAALWVLIAGLGLLVLKAPGWSGTGWTLLLASALGFGVQGIAVVESLLLSRGVPLSVISVTLLFMLVVALPAFALAAVTAGLGDAWLDFRKLEPASRADDAPSN